MTLTCPYCNSSYRVRRPGQETCNRRKCREQFSDFNIDSTIGSSAAYLEYRRERRNSSEFD